MARVFISYRRLDNPYVAGILRDALQERFGRDEVFFDLDNIPFGVDFRRYIADAVGSCDVLLVVIGDQWLNLTTDKGERRLDDPSDFVRIEIEAALKRDIPVIPVLIDDARMPQASELPESIRDMAFRNATEIRAGRDQRHQVERLMSGLAEASKSADFANEAGSRAYGPRSLTGKHGGRVQINQLLKVTPGETKVDDEIAFLEKVHQAFQGLTGHITWLAGQIPKEKAAAAIANYAQNVSFEEIVLLYDQTFFGSAKYGAILTANSIYWRNGRIQRAEHCRYVDIRDVTTQFASELETRILINGRLLLVTGPRATTASAFVTLLRGLKPERF